MFTCSLSYAILLNFQVGSWTFPTPLLRARERDTLRDSHYLVSARREISWYNSMTRRYFLFSPNFSNIAEHWDVSHHIIMPLRFPHRKSKIYLPPWYRIISHRRGENIIRIQSWIGMNVSKLMYRIHMIDHAILVLWPDPDSSLHAFVICYHRQSWLLHILYSYIVSFSPNWSTCVEIIVSATWQRGAVSCIRVRPMSTPRGCHRCEGCRFLFSPLALLESC